MSEAHHIYLGRITSTPISSVLTRMVLIFIVIMILVVVVMHMVFLATLLLKRRFPDSIENEGALTESDSSAHNFITLFLLQLNLRYRR